MTTYFIYSITNSINNFIYIGSTVNLERRWLKHKRDIETHPMSIYMNNNGIEFFKINLLHTYQCDKITARQYEQQEMNLIEQDLLLNQRKAFRSVAERKAEHKIAALKYTRANADKLKTYYQLNREKILAKRLVNRDQHIQYMKEYRAKKKVSP